MGHYCSTVLGRVWLCESKDIYIVGKTFLFHINAVPLKFLFIYIHGFLKNIASLFSTLIITFMFLGHQISILECFLKIVWNGELKLLLSMCIWVYFICRRNDLHVCVLLLISTVITIKSQINCYFEHKKRPSSCVSKVRNSAADIPYFTFRYHKHQWCFFYSPLPSVWTSQDPNK